MKSHDPFLGSAFEKKKKIPTIASHSWILMSNKKRERNRDRKGRRGRWREEGVGKKKRGRRKKK